MKSRFTWEWNRIPARDEEKVEGLQLFLGGTPQNYYILDSNGSEDNKPVLTIARLEQKSGELDYAPLEFSSLWEAIQYTMDFSVMVEVDGDLE